MSTHEDMSRGVEVKASSDRVFGLVMTVVFGLVAFWPLIRGEQPRWWAAGVSSAFLLAALAAPAVLHPLNRLWMGLAIVLHRITTPIITGILFYLIFTPMGFLMRRSGKDPLRLKLDPDAQTYWQLRDPAALEAAPEQMTRQF